MSRNLCGKELEFGMVSSNHLDVRTVFHYLRDALIQDLAIPYAVDFHELCRDREDLLLDPSSLEDEDEEEIPSGESIFLGNGFRFYLDMRKIEASTPECFRVSEVITWERGMAYLLEEALYIATLKARADGFHGEIDLLKNNMDMYGNTYGCHWNILTDRKNPLLYDPTDFRDIAKVLVPFFATSSIYTGAGTCVDKEGNIHWSISARSLFMEEDSSSSTTSKRGLVNLRDEPLANREKYRRLHLISPDHNMSEFQAWLGLGIATLVVGMVECGDP